MDVIIKPKLLEGTITIPPSKSLAHRAIIAASLANGVSIIENIDLSEDIKATIKGMEALGSSIQIDGNRLIIKGSSVQRKEKVIDANESGSTLRFLIPIALVSKEEITFTGKNNLVNRPLDLYLDLFDKFDISYKKEDKSLPLTVKGGLKSGLYEVRGDVSSQFISGLLFALPLLDGDSEIRITTELESANYLTLTLDVLRHFGIEIKETPTGYFIRGRQSYQKANYYVEGDFSQAAFYLVGDMLGANIKLKGLNLNSSQGDRKIIDDIKAFGGVIYEENGLIWAKLKEKKKATISFKQTPDLGPALSVLASCLNVEAKFVDCARLKIKECDRILAMQLELNKLGGSVSSTEDTMEFKKGIIHGGIVDSHNDHRVVMSLAMISNIIDEPLIITNANAIKKSYPHFFKDFVMLGGIVDEQA